MSNEKEIVMMNRRILLQRIAAVAGTALWSGESVATEMAKTVASRDLPEPSLQPKRLTAARMATLSALTDLIIPVTDTPGAIAAGVPAFIGDMYLHWFTEAERAVFAEGLDALDRDSRARFGKAFSKCTVSQKTESYAALRTKNKDYTVASMPVRIVDPAAPFFFKVRDLTTVGYFTSELGVTKQLAYVPVPGRFEGDIDIKTWNKQMPG